MIYLVKFIFYKLQFSFLVHRRLERYHAHVISYLYIIKDKVKYFTSKFLIYSHFYVFAAADNTVQFFQNLESDWGVNVSLKNLSY